jgi:hypothetical protein
MSLSDSTISPSTNASVIGNSVNIGTTTSGLAYATNAGCDPSVIYPNFQSVGGNGLQGCAAILQLNLPGGPTTVSPYYCPTADSWCSAAMVNRWQAMSNSNFGTLAYQTGCSMTAANSTRCLAVRVQSESAIETSAVHSKPQTYTNQQVDKTTTMSPAPSSTPTSGGLIGSSGDDQLPRSWAGQRLQLRPGSRNMELSGRADGTRWGTRSNQHKFPAGIRRSRKWGIIGSYVGGVGGSAS